MRVIIVLLLVLLIAAPVSADIVRERTMDLEGDIEMTSVIESGDNKAGTKVSGSGSYVREEWLAAKGDLEYGRLTVSYQSQFETSPTALGRLKVISSIISSYGVYAESVSPDKAQLGFIGQDLVIGESFSLENQSGVAMGIHKLYVLLASPDAASKLIDEMRVRGRTNIYDLIEIRASLEERGFVD